MDEQLTTEQTSVDEAEAQAIAEAQAGYEGKARAQAPAETQPVEQEQPLADSAPEEQEPDPQAEPEPSPQDAVAAQLDDLKAQVKQLAERNADADTVRKMHGEIGNINRTLKQLKALEKADAPAEDEMAAALKDAEAIAGEYPEIAGPMVRAIKALQARLPAPVVQEEQPQAEEDQQPAQAAPAQKSPEQIAQEAAVKALDEVHPDRHTVKESAEFKGWFAQWMTPEYRKKVTSSWNPAVVAEPFTAFKAWKAAQQRKQERLDAAATPQGLPRATPSTISDEEAARIGYERAKAKRL